MTQFANGETWLTTPSTHDNWRELYESVVAPTQETQRPSSVTLQPAPEVYARHVAHAVEILRRKEIDKVVLARAVLGTVPDPFDAAAIAQRLRQREPICTLYSLPTDDGRRFVGASPELLVRRRADTIECHPLAGTITLPENVSPDDYETWLLGSTKNLHEHALVVDEIVSNLSNVYDDITVDAEPSIVALRTVAHLGTRLSARWSSHEPRPTHSTCFACSTRRLRSAACLARARTSCCADWKSTIGATSPDQLDGLTQRATASGGLDCAGFSCVDASSKPGPERESSANLIPSPNEKRQRTSSRSS